MKDELGQAKNAGSWKLPRHSAIFYNDPLNYLILSANTESNPENPAFSAGDAIQANTQSSN